MQLIFATSPAAIGWTLVITFLSAVTGYLNAKRRRILYALLFLPSGFALAQGAWFHRGAAAITWGIIFAVTFLIEYNIQARLGDARM